MQKRLKKGKSLTFPRRRIINEQKEGKMLTVFKTDKEQHLHSVSACIDNETFIAADESRINMFHLERKESSIFSLVDYERKSTTFEDERITYMTNNRFSG